MTRRPTVMLVLGAGIGLVSAAIAYVISLDILILSGMLIMWIWWTLSLFRRHGDIAESGPWLSTLYIMYVLGYLADQVATSGSFSDWCTPFLSLSALGLLGLMAGYSIPSRPGRVHALPNQADIRLGAVALILIAIPSIIAYFAAFGGLSEYLSVGYGGDHWQVIGSSPIMGSGMEWFGLGLAVLVLVSKSRLERVFAIVGFALWASTNLAAGLRGSVLRALFVVFFWIGSRDYYSLRRRWLGKKTLVLLVILYVFMQWVGVIREYLPLGIVGAVRQGTMVLAERPALLLPWRFGEFIMPGGALHELLVSKHAWTPLWGSSYLSALLNVIPGLNRLLVRDGRIVSLASWRMEVFWPALWQEGRGYGFFAPAEGYLNFGVVGVFLHMLGIGYAAKRLYSTLAGRRSSAFPLMLYSTAVPVLLTSGLRIDSSAWLWSYTRVYFPVVILSLGIAALRSALRRTRGRYEEIYEREASR